MATKRLRAGAWRYTVRRAGVLPKPVYLTFADESEGDEYVRRLEALLDRGIVPDDIAERPVRVDVLRDQARKYLAEQHVSATDRDNLRIVLERLPASMPLRDVTYVWASAWVTRMKREDNLSPVTIRHHVGALSRCLDWVAALGGIVANPLRMLPKGYAVYTVEDGRAVTAVAGKLKVAEERDRRLAVDEEVAIREILAGAKPAARQRALELPHAGALLMLFDLALESAMRMREMYTLEREQIDLPRRTIFLDRTKNGDRRQVPLSSVALARLAEFIGDRAPGRIFPWWNGKRDSNVLAQTTSRLSRQFDRIFSAAGCGDLNFHDLRHEATSRIFERTTLGEMEIAKITGHRSLRSLARYANLRGSVLAERLW